MATLTTSSKPAWMISSDDVLSHEQTDAHISAMGCALMRHIESLKPAPNRLFLDPYAKLFLSEAHLREYRALDEKTYRQNSWLVWLGALREKFFDDCLTQAIQNDIRQLVIPGAGYDTRALRIQKLKDREILVFEVDQAFMIEGKRRQLLDHLHTIPAHLRLVSMDFHRDEFAPLLNSGYGMGRKSLFIAQALSYYLAPFAFEKILQFFAVNQHPESRFLFDYVDVITMEQMGGGSYWDNLNGNRPFSIDPDVLEEYVSQFGLKAVLNEPMTTIEKKYTGEATLPVDGWYMAECELA